MTQSAGAMPAEMAKKVPDTFSGMPRGSRVGVIAVAAGLMAIGAVMTFSAGASLDEPPADRPFWADPELRQLAFVGAGLIVMLISASVPYRFWRWRTGKLWQPALTLLALGLAALALVFVPGVGLERRGAQRWMQFGPEKYGVGFQASDLTKLAMLVFLAAWLSARRVKASRFFRGLIPACLAAGLCVAGVGIEDFGTAALMAAVAGGVIFAAGAKKRHLVLLVIPAVAILGYLLVSKPYRVKRLTAFTQIWENPRGDGYHAVQSLCTIANGGWWGRGLGGGVQKYGYLPASRTDFIFAVICEELGMVGALLVIGLLLALLWQGRAAMRGAPDRFGSLLALGITLMIGMQAAMNIAVVTVSVPTKGIALPLVSAGGSGLILTAAMIGLLANIAAHSRAGLRC